MTKVPAVPKYGNSREGTVPYPGRRTCVEVLCCVLLAYIAYQWIVKTNAFNAHSLLCRNRHSKDTLNSFYIWVFLFSSVNRRTIDSVRVLLVHWCVTEHDTGVTWLIGRWREERSWETDEWVPNGWWNWFYKGFYNTQKHWDLFLKNLDVLKFLQVKGQCTRSDNSFKHLTPSVIIVNLFSRVFCVFREITCSGDALVRLAKAQNNSQTVLDNNNYRNSGEFHRTFDRPNINCFKTINIQSSMT